MDIISNIVGSLSPSQFDGAEKGSAVSFDLNDKTFADLLEKQMNNMAEENEFNITQTFGIPSGIDIGDFDGAVPNIGTNREGDFSSVKSVESTGDFDMQNFDNKKEFSTSEVLTFFPSLFELKPTMTQNLNNGLFNFERKVAAGSYGKYARNIVTDLQEFVSDALKLA